MFFRQKKIKKKSLIDYVLEDDEFGLKELFNLDDKMLSSVNGVRILMLGPENGTIENTKTVWIMRVARFMSILAGVAEKYDIIVPDAYQLYHAMLASDAWGKFMWAGRVDHIKNLVQLNFDNFPNDQKQALIAYVRRVLSLISSFEDAKAFIQGADERIYEC